MYPCYTYSCDCNNCVTCIDVIVIPVLHVIVIPVWLHIAIYNGSNTGQLLVFGFNVKLIWFLIPTNIIDLNKTKQS